MCLGVMSAMAEGADSTKVKNESHALNLYGFARSEMYMNSRVMNTPYRGI